MTKKKETLFKHSNEAQNMVESMERSGVCVPAPLRAAAETQSLLHSIRAGTPFMPAALRKMEGN